MMENWNAFNLLNYLEELPPIKLRNIYESHWTCQAVLRALPPIAKQYVLRILFIAGSVPENTVSNWSQSAASDKHAAALDAMQRLQILQPQPDRAGGCSYALQPAFQANLQRALCLRHPGGSGGVPAAVKQAAPSPADVEKYSSNQWEALLLYLMDPNKGAPAAPAYMEQKRLEVWRLFSAAGLVEENARSSRWNVTRAGFQFLFSDTYRQMWRLLREYIDMAEASSGAELTSTIGFLLHLGFRSTPCAYSDLSPEEQRMAADMAALGVLCPFQTADRRVYVSPTPLACSICAGGSAGAKAVDGFIIVETNFKVYAYTSSATRISILRQFMRLEVILPNLVVGTITRESAVQAFTSSITASQIVTFLRQHASPHIAERVPVVPQVIADQIHLWENEQNRVRTYEASLFENFGSQEAFQKACKHAREIGVWLWQDDKKLRLVTMMHGFDDMKKFIKANK